MTENASPGQQPSFGMAMRFNVVVDGISLGNWASCKGLEFTCEPVKFHEHGNYDYETILFVKVKYAVVKLERAIDKVASGQLRQWLSSELNSQPGTQLLGIGGKTATIKLLDGGTVPKWVKLKPAVWDNKKDKDVRLIHLLLMGCKQCGSHQKLWNQQYDFKRIRQHLGSMMFINLHYFIDKVGMVIQLQHFIKNVITKELL